MRSKPRVGLLIALTALALAAPAQAAYPGMNGRIAFTERHTPTGGRDIWLMNPDGTGKANITNSAAAFLDHVSPVWSPDGTTIAFSSNRTGGSYDIYVMSADGTGVVRLTSLGGVATSPTWSPNGAQLAFDHLLPGPQTDVEVMTMNANGSGITNRTNNPANDQQPAWSPDGTKIAFHSDRDGNRNIYVMNPDGTGLTRLTRDPAIDVAAAWSSDGAKIYFTRVTTGSAIYVMNADGTGQMRLANFPLDTEFPAPSPDNSKIAFVGGPIGCSANDCWEIYSASIDGTGLAALTANSVANDDPDWQPLAAPPPPGGQFKNAAKRCKAEREADESAFRSRYRNFGKCVSQ
jgi:tol-pal system beta propeller repeat protein TolB